MGKEVKTFFYVDKHDNHKSTFAVIDDNREIRDLAVIEKIGAALEDFGFGKKGVCNSVAYNLAYHNYAELDCSMGSYEFGVETAIAL